VTAFSLAHAENFLSASGFGRWPHRCTACHCHRPGRKRLHFYLHAAQRWRPIGWRAFQANPMARLPRVLATPGTHLTGLKLPVPLRLDFSLKGWLQILPDQANKSTGLGELRPARLQQAPAREAEPSGNHPRN